MQKIKLIFIIIFVLSLFLIKNNCFASDLFFETEQSQISIGDVFFVDVKIDNLKNGCINTAQIDILFPKDKLVLTDFNAGNSFLSIWKENPSTADIKKIEDKGKISFSGGVPGGYCGVIPGDPGDSNVLGRLFFQVVDKKENLSEKVEIKFSKTTRVLLNDGLGTADNLQKNDFSFVIQPKNENQKNALQEQIVLDNTKPEPFVIYLQQNKKMFNGDYYIEFNAIDRQTGIDHYEILELRKNEKAGVATKRTFLDYFFKKNRIIPNWEKINSPYRLKDQSLSSVISIRAVDRAGNERFVDYVPPKDKQQKVNTISQFEFFVILLIIIIVIIFFFLLIVFFIKKNKQRKKEKELNPKEEIY